MQMKKLQEQQKSKQAESFLLQTHLNGGEGGDGVRSWQKGKDYKQYLSNTHKKQCLSNNIFIKTFINLKLTSVPKQHDGIKTNK